MESFDPFGSARLYKAWHDGQKYNSGFILCSPQEAHDLNQQGWCIFHEVQLFNGSRLNDNCVEIRSWFVDLDGGDKERQEEAIRQSPLSPSRIVETKNGYHIYFAVKDKTATIENYGKIQKALVQSFGGDPKPVDMARVLRTPSFLQWKGRPQEGYFVESKYISDAYYTEAMMLKNFVMVDVTEKETKEDLKITFSEGGVWERIYNMNHMEALKRISGSHWVGGERFTFRKTAKGKFNILVNGKGTSAFVDSKWHIGASGQGGTTVFHWINWYQKNREKSYEAMKELFPELWINQNSTTHNSGLGTNV